MLSNWFATTGCAGPSLQRYWLANSTSCLGGAFQINLIAIFPALIFAACDTAPSPPGLVEQPEIFEQPRAFEQSPIFEQARPFELPVHIGPLGIDLAADTSDVVDQLRGSGVDFVARYYRDPTSSLPALSPAKHKNCRHLV